ncbi:hypothetical protein HAX54_022780, partial [Datura stramonium]|nr:hypothetical protein [Datura stramonium]
VPPFHRCRLWQAGVSTNLGQSSLTSSCVALMDRRCRLAAHRSITSKPLALHIWHLLDAGVDLRYTGFLLLL